MSRGLTSNYNVGLDGGKSGHSFGGPLGIKIGW